MRYDFNIVGGMAGTIDAFSDVDAHLLLLGGSKSPKYLQEVRTRWSTFCRMPTETSSKAWITLRLGPATSVTTLLRIAAMRRAFFGADQTIMRRKGRQSGAVI